MNLSRDFQLLIAVVAAIAGVAGALALRGWLRLLVLIAGLLIAAYLLGWLPKVRL
jgi:hypothetical protein